MEENASAAETEDEAVSFFSFSWIETIITKNMGGSNSQKKKNQ